MVSSCFFGQKSLNHNRIRNHIPLGLTRVHLWAVWLWGSSYSDLDQIFQETTTAQWDTAARRMYFSSESCGCLWVFFIFIHLLHQNVWVCAGFLNMAIDSFSILSRGIGLSLFVLVSHSTSRMCQILWSSLTSLSSQCCILHVLNYILLLHNNNNNNLYTNIHGYLHANTQMRFIPSHQEMCRISV